MSVETWVQIGFSVIAVIAFILLRQGMKPFIPVGLFASLYANVWCYLAMRFGWWDFPARLVPFVREISVPANMLIVPVMAMIWVRYSPMKRLYWALLWTCGLTGGEFLIERYTAVLKYHSGYDWYFSFLLWFASWFIWYYFHRWFWRKD
ncbi:MAG: competence protein [Negativicutes bacterium]|nr:competence protein [Negativicutes bacterium]